MIKILIQILSIERPRIHTNSSLLNGRWKILALITENKLNSSEMDEALSFRTDSNGLKVITPTCILNILNYLQQAKKEYLSEYTNLNPTADISIWTDDLCKSTVDSTLELQVHVKMTGIRSLALLLCSNGSITQWNHTCFFTEQSIYSFIWLHIYLSVYISIALLRVYICTYAHIYL